MLLEMNFYTYIGKFCKISEVQKNRYLINGMTMYLIQIKSENTAALKYWTKSFMSAIFRLHHKKNSKGRVTNALYPPYKEGKRLKVSLLEIVRLIRLEM